MSDQGSEQDKSELPTPFRLEKARRQGQVARGADLAFMSATAAFVLYVAMLGPSLGTALVQAMRDSIMLAPGLADGPRPVLGAIGAVFSLVVRPVGFLIAAIYLTVLVLEIVQTGPVFTTEPLRLDFSKLNPATGLKRIFSLRLLLETAKTLAKFLVYGVLAWLAIKAAIGVSALGLSGAPQLAQAMRRATDSLLAAFLGAAVIFAALDQLVARRDYLKKMRMSRRDIKREARDREGEPRLKQKRKALHAEFVKASASLRNVRGADMLITNPTHYAVALRYDPARMDAPIVVARGAHRFALRLRRLAFLYGVVIVRNPPLARLLYRCELNAPVPEAAYQAVANLYRSVRARAETPTEDLNA